jgi:DNA-binding MarR family transcriptional regulator
MSYTYIVPTAADQLTALDDLLAAVRLVGQRPGYRHRLLAGLEIPGGVTTIRLLRAVEAHAEGAPSIGDVATRLAVEHSTASRSVDAAAKNGLLSKHSCADDLRRTRLELTASGRAVLSKTSARRKQLLGAATAGWSGEDLARLNGLLDAVLAGFDRLESSTAEERVG